MTALEPIEALYQAIGAPLGIVVSVSDFELARARLYAARRQAADPALDALQLRHSGHGVDNELWIVNAGPRPQPADEPTDAPAED